MKKSGKKKPGLNRRQFNEMRNLLIENSTTLRTDVLRQMLTPGKNINYSCGYPDTISITQYKSMYDREGLATRVTNLLPDESWAINPDVFIDEKAERNDWEKKWDEIVKKHNVYHYLHRIDALSGVGQFGVLLIGINDGMELNEPVEGINEKTGESINQKERELLYLRPFDESLITIKNTEKDITSPRFGQPTMYSINFEDVEESGTLKDKLVHWTRILHVADNRTVSEVLGIPRMQTVYNRLYDIKKIMAGSGEMFWRGGFPGYSFEIAPELAGSVTEASKTTMRDEFFDWQNGLQRWLLLSGVTAKSLAPQVADPTPHMTAHIKYIAMSKGIPYRIFLGTEESKLASTQDTMTWNKRLAHRQEDYITPMLVRPFIDHLIALGIMPVVDEYFVKWEDLNSPDEKEQAEVAKIKTEALAKYVGAGVDSLIVPNDFLMMILGMTEEEVKTIEENSLAHQEVVDEEANAEMEAREQEIVMRETEDRKRRQQQIKDDVEANKKKTKKGKKKKI